MKRIVYTIIALAFVHSCKKEDDIMCVEEKLIVRDTITCEVIKNKGSLVISVCNGDTITII